MKPEQYQELFNLSAYPVFMLSPRGRILYKNPAAHKYLPMLRKKACAVKHFYPSEMPKKSGVLRIMGDTPYRIALLLRDEDGFLALCLSRFQYGDGVAAAGRFLHRFGDTAFDFLGNFHKEAVRCANEAIPARIYTDVFALAEIDGMLLDTEKYSFAEITAVLFEKLNRSFGALGYRIHAKIEEGFSAQKEVTLHLHDFLYIFGKLLYLQMRLSQNGDVSVSLESDEKEHIFRFSVKAKALGVCAAEDVHALVALAVPECVSEFALLEKAGMLGDDIFRLSCDPFGMLTVEYRIPYRENTVLPLRSGDACRLLLAEDICGWLGYIEKRLTDNGAFY